MGNFMPEEITKQIGQLQEENRHLQNAVEELSVLNDIATAITSTQSIDRIVNLIVQKCVRHLHVEQGAVMLLHEKDQKTPLHTMVRRADSQVGSLPYRLDKQLTGWMLKNKSALLINNFPEDQRFQYTKDERDKFIHSLLSVPLLVKGCIIGVLTVFNKRSEEGFTEEDKRLLSIIAVQSAQIIENARLYREEQDLLRMQEEVRLAKEIQMNLLPKALPDIVGYQIAGRSIPAKDVGGDYFDFIAINENRIAICLGDVSGKGMPAALLMANLQATLRGQSLLCGTCKDCIARSNTLLYRSTDPQKYATLFYGILDTKTHKLTYCNAGHDNPFLFSAGKSVQRLQTGGIVLGFLPEYPYTEGTITFRPGSLLLIYSDGVTEAMNSKGKEFSEERLTCIAEENLSEPAELIIEKILEALTQHAGAEPQMDDITLVIVKRKKE